MRSSRKVTKYFLSLDSKRSWLNFVNTETFLAKPTFPSFHLFLVQLLKSRGPSYQKFSTSEFKLFIYFLILLLEKLSSFVLCLCLEPIRCSRNTLNFLCILLSLLEFLIHFYSFLDYVHFFCSWRNKLGFIEFYQSKK